MIDERLSQTRVFAYDSINRLIASTGGPSGTIAYGLDGVGNRGEVTGGPDPGTYTMDDTTPSPADEQMNQYTTVPRGAPAGSVTMELEHDLNGNLRLIPFQADDETTPVLATATYDYRNLMVKYERGDFTAEYKYDALGRRIEKTLTENEDTTSTLYLYNGFQVVEERDGVEEVEATYAYGNGIDEVLNMRRGGEDYFYHADDQGTVWAVTDDAGSVVERYNYEDYGETHVLDPSGDPRTGSAIGNPYRYTSRRFDSESDLYWYRTRYYDPVAGRFVSRDSIGGWTDASNLGNQHGYSGTDPWSWTDSFGTVRTSGPCWDSYNDRIAECNRLTSAKDRALCFAAAMDFLISCDDDEEGVRREREKRDPRKPKPKRPRRFRLRFRIPFCIPLELLNPQDELCDYPPLCPKPA